jgi:hypothetical protein
VVDSLQSTWLDEAGSEYSEEGSLVEQQERLPCSICSISPCLLGAETVMIERWTATDRLGLVGLSSGPQGPQGIRA